MIYLARFVKKVVGQFTLLDWAIVKADLVIVGLLLAKLFPVLTSLHRGWYLGFIILCECYFIWKIWGNKK